MLATESSDPQRRYFAPEVVQTSAMDCGPAALKCLLEGFGVSASYGRLREACQTDVDGTSIDTLEDVAVQLGLAAQQIMVSADHLLAPEAQTLPALVVTVLPNGLTHFIVAWRRHGRFVQLMDPATGRRWSTQSRFLDEVYRHVMPISAAVWRRWAHSDGFRAPLGHRLTNLGLEAPDVTQLVEAASEDPGWRSLAALDAATRIVDAVVDAGGVERGAEARGLIEHFFQQNRQAQPAASDVIPASFWTVQPMPRNQDGVDRVAESAERGDEQLLLRGAVLVRVLGRRAPDPSEVDEPAETATVGAPAPPSPDAPTSPAAQSRTRLSSSLAAALEEPPGRPEMEVLRTLQADGLLTPAVVAIALFLAAVGLTIEALLLRGLMDRGCLNRSVPRTKMRAGARTDGQTSRGAGERRSRGDRENRR